jgi:hypothetical protein
MNHHACERSCHHKRGLGVWFAVFRSDHWSFVSRARRFHRRALKGAIMNTTHSSSLAVEVPAYAQLQRKMHDPRKASPEGSQFPRTGWIAQLVHTVCSVVAPRCDRTGCRRRRSGDALLAQHPDWILPNGDCPTLRLLRRAICEAAHPNVANGASQTEARQHSISIRIPISFPRHYDA